MGEDFVIKALVNDLVSIQLRIWVIYDKIGQICHTDVDTLEHLLCIQKLLVLKEILEDQGHVLSKIIWLFSKRIVKEVPQELMHFDLVLLANAYKLLSRVISVLEFFVLVEHVQDFSSDTLRRLRFLILLVVHTCHIGYVH